MLDTSLTLLNGVDDKVVERATCCSHGDIIFIVNDSEIAEPTVKAFDPSLGFELVQTAQYSILRLVGGQRCLRLIGSLPARRKLVAQLLKSLRHPGDICFGLCQLLLGLGLFLLQTRILILLATVVVFEPLKVYSSLLESGLGAGCLLCKEVPLRCGDVDGGLLITDLSCPWFEFSLFSFDFGREFFGLVCLISNMTRIANNKAPFKLSRTSSSSASSTTSFFSRSVTFLRFISSS